MFVYPFLTENNNSAEPVSVNNGGARSSQIKPSDVFYEVLETVQHILYPTAAYR